MKIRYVLSLAILLGLSGMAQAQWLDLGLSNGDFSTPGSYGTLGNGISLSANNGTADNGKLFAGWKAFGGDYSAAASSYSGAAQVTAPPGSGASGKQRGAYIVHDALAGVTIEKTIYKLTFDAKIDTYSYKTYAGLLWGNTDIYNPDTWKSTSYFDFTLDQSDSRRWTSGTWQFTGSPGVSTWTTFTLYWDNTDAGTWTPTDPPANYTVIHRAVNAPTKAREGESLRVGFVGSKYGASGGTVNIDNVSLSKYLPAGNYWAPASGGGGSGTWDSSVSVWATAAGVPGTAPQATTGALIFTDAAGTVTVNGTVTANQGLTIKTSGYNLIPGTSSPNISLAGATLADNTITTDANVKATIAAVLSGSNGMQKAGAGTLVLTGTSAYTGPTNIAAGALEANQGVGLTGKNLRLAGGVFQGHGPDDATFTRGLGTGDGQVQWTDGAGTPAATSGGFSAANARLTVNINGLGTPDPLTWASTSYFVANGQALIFGSTSANNVVEFQNPVALNGGTRSVQVDRGTGGDRAEMPGVVSGGTTNDVLTKTGAGTLVLSAETNTYAGPTNIVGGALEAVDSVSAGSAKSLPATNLRLAGGAYQGHGPSDFTFTRSLGTGATNVQWTDGTATTTDGGFSARNAKLTVNIGGSPTPAQLTWRDTGNVDQGTEFFVAAGKALLFGSNSADNVVEFRNPVDLNAPASAVEREVRVDRGTGGDLAIMSGVISGGSNATLKKSGEGTLVLGATINTYAGPTRITGGALEGIDSTSMGTASSLPTTNVNLSGGVFQGQGSSDTIFTRSLGTSDNLVQWTDNGGFSARGCKLTVNIGGAGTPAMYTWASTSNFVQNGKALLFGSNSANNVVEFQNGVDLNQGVRTIQVTAGTGGDLAVMSGQIIGFAGSGLIKSGSGTLVLTGGNTYSGTTTVTGGALEAVDGGGLPGALTLAGGVFQGHAIGEPPATLPFNRALGAGSTAVQWTGDGGFAAREAKLTVNLGGLEPPAGLTWGSGGFVPSGNALVFGSNSANREVEFRNPIELGSAARTVRVDAGRGGDFATLSGTLSGTGGQLVKEGAGTLRLAVANSFTGGVNVNAGTLELNHEDAIAVPASTTGQDLQMGKQANVVLGTGLAKAVQVRALTMHGGTSPTGTVDLKTGQLIVDGTATPAATIAAQIASAYNLADPDNPWKGLGITSSSAAAQAERYAVGYALNSDFGELAWGTWFGRTANPDSVLIRFTYAGDADLSGEVTTDDFDNWKQGYITHGSGWLRGDLDYSGDVTTDDFDLWKQVYVKHYAPMGDGSGGGKVASLAVPEPGVLVLLALAGLGLLVWRRRK